jgi:hypothetical protein
MAATGAGDDAWIVATLRELRDSTPPGEEAALYHALVHRYETDPGYRTYIRRIADETDAQPAAEDAARGQQEGQP